MGTIPLKHSFPTYTPLLPPLPLPRKEIMVSNPGKNDASRTQSGARKSINDDNINKKIKRSRKNIPLLVLEYSWSCTTKCCSNMVYSWCIKYKHDKDFIDKLRNNWHNTQHTDSPTVIHWHDCIKTMDMENKK
mmetsp:Transcript_908/g.1566  ORF Transcript_908/g.1566 Transcript_908/m.1566 type:complete len:133 (+) Transcript_908:73-471(+)